MHTRLVTNGALYKEEKYPELFGIVDTLDVSFRKVDDMQVQDESRPVNVRQLSGA